MSGFDKVQSREAGLHQGLTAAQMSMIAIGGAIGTGLFLGSKLAITLAGPGIIISYVFAGAIALMLMGCLAEMTIHHATSGSFGAYAEYYISPLMGFLVRYCYWSSIVLGVGTEVTAIAVYMGFWLPNVPGWVWIATFSFIVISVNASSVKLFGTFEYWFSTIKVYAIVAFIIIGAIVIARPNSNINVASNLLAYGGFLPHGLKGVLFASVVALFSYFSIEMIAVAAAESADPGRSVRKAFKATVARLLIFYLLSLSIVVMLVPWKAIVATGATSPYVTVMRDINIPYADSILNFVVIVASLSSMDSMLYVSTRMLFSLARAGDAPTVMGKVSVSGIPLYALAASSVGVGVAAVIYYLFKGSAFAVMIALSMFGAMFAWGMIFVTHLFFRTKVNALGERLSFKMYAHPIGTLFGLVGIIVLYVTSWFTEQFHLMLVFGVPFVVALAAIYVARGRLRRDRAVWTPNRRR